MRFLTTTVLATCLFLLSVAPAHSQNPRRTERAFVSSIAALGMGDVGVALPHPMSGFFYNPAHLPHTPSATRVLGLQGTLSDQVREQSSFFDDRLEPAIEQGLDNIPDEQLETLYNDALAITGTPSQGSVGLLLPAFTRNLGGVVGIGGGLYAQTDASFRLYNAGLGVPQVSLINRNDFIAVASAGVQLPAGISGGATVKYTKRYLSFKDKPLDTFTSDEQVVLLEGTNLGIDVGGLYEVNFLPLPGRLTVGMTVYDLLHTGYNYDVYGTPADIPIVGSFIDASGSISAERVAAEVALAQARFNLEQSYRIGAGYQLDRLGPFSDIAFGADYIGYGSPQVDQTFLAHLHLGARAHLTRFLALRTGISQGYPSVGAGLHLGVFHVNYALHAVEQGRTPGQVSSYIHALRFAFEL
ncbi:hypothetical protein [Salisaeta longa]|uniref:hypothetical protein n=1 Tax=Salisaeta longa TaxID=503170 RepID=UPI00048AE12C|nr:hypothetical protein [Salisaeta longa]